MKNLLIIGATSAIAEATARLFAENGWNIYLLARNHEKLTSIADDLKIRGSSEVQFDTLDVTDLDAHNEILTKVFKHFDTLDACLIAHGSLPDQQACEASAELTLKELNTNAISTISLLTHLANLFETQGSGVLSVITSVAGDRGRKSNYVYGSAKGMVSVFLQGLRNRLYGSNVQVVDVKPGFVDTPMTEGFDKSGFLWAKPDRIASDIYKGIKRGGQVVYTPFFWRLIMLIIKLIPEIIFKRLSL
jgi:short-subunit dehydrogenase